VITVLDAGTRYAECTASRAEGRGITDQGHVTALPVEAGFARKQLVSVLPNVHSFPRNCCD